MARRRLRLAEAHVRKQRRIVERLQAQHHPTNMAEALLREFEQTRDDHLTDLAGLIAEQARGLRDAEGNPTLDGPMVGR